MLIGQASINLSANILSALLGLLSVIVFTRLFSPHDYGIYLLGVGFAAVVSTFLVGWFRNLILMYGPAVRCKKISSNWRWRSCINVSGL
jgi:O-antigen/teichoic acid export membrane protein